MEEEEDGWDKMTDLQTLSSDVPGNYSKSVPTHPPSVNFMPVTRDFLQPGVWLYTQWE